MNSVLVIFYLFTLAYAGINDLKAIVNHMINQKLRTNDNNVDGVTDVAGLISKINTYFNDGKIYENIKNEAIQNLNASVRLGTVTADQARQIINTINQFEVTTKSGRSERYHGFLKKR